ncbi:protein mono-ADP-ribosyltransferase PARP9 isoform X2 [Conger conger]|uniref:protein mono-ADP-ribosyltransferase PARP9 isoform X2 n=1 Tax=Conger conger TaxID=82655 RepID=UPI002A59FBA8|nr:protein mono-ADP-ribosyltransferase PARP9 isoform X2 [Conger conger]
MSEGTMMPVDPATAQLLAQCGEVLIHVVQKKFGISAVLHNIQRRDASGGATAAQTGGEKRCSVRLPGGLEVSVWRDDLTTHQVDAVVNAANEDLRHGGGLAGALSRAGGPQFQQLSDQYIKMNGKVRTGRAVVTQPGNLPCKAVIHAVGPYIYWSAIPGEVQRASPLLKQAVESVLHLAEKEGFRSVAMPALSSGLFNFPLDACAEVIVSTLKDYHYGSGSQLREVRLVNNDERTVSAMELAFRKILDSKASYSRAVKDARPTSSSLQMDAVTMHIKKGNIEQEKVDVIVNTISQDLNLSMGNVSTAILKKAGSKIQKDISSHSPRSPQFGDVIETRGHMLHSQKVYHTICSSSEGQGSKILREIVKKCLDRAVKNNYSSISFPAIGTGNLGFKEEEVAKLMIGEVAYFAKQHKRQKMDVYFVLFPSDVKIITAFEKEMQHQKSEHSVQSSNASKGSSGSYERDWPVPEDQPCIELPSSSEVDHREARRWVYDTLFHNDKQCTIFNNHVLHFGQSEHKKLLSLQATFHLSIQEFLRDGQAGVIIAAPSQSGMQEAALRVEALCCEAQEEFAQTEESAMMHAVVRWRCREEPGFEQPEITGTLERARLAERDRVTVTENGCNLQVSLRKMEASDPTGKGCRIERIGLYKDNPMDRKFSNRSFYQRTLVKDLTNGDRPVLPYGLDVVKIEKVENPLLEHLFQQKQRQVSGGSRRMYQQVPAQFCDLVCRVGFQRQYSPPKDQPYGAGIYFGSSVSSAKKLADHLEKEEYVYIFEAQVLTGKDTHGSPDLIIPPVLGSDPLSRYDSVKGGRDTHVIFNSHQALPVYLFTCKNRSPSILTRK